MNPSGLVDHIRSGPEELLLDKPLRFRRRMRSNPCDFNEFLQALRASETIRTVDCGPHTELEITEDKWELLVKTLGRIKHIEHLELCSRAGYQDFRPFQAIADAIKIAHSLCKLRISYRSIWNDCTCQCSSRAHDLGRLLILALLSSWRNFRVRPSILCSSRYRLAPTYGRLPSIPNALVPTL
jgi:hypothetical protein